MDSTQSVAPEVIVCGDGEPAAVVVGGVHGDEPSGVRAIRRIIDAHERNEIAFEHTVKFIIANPPALAENRRYLESDMNRSFPGDAEGTLEERLATVVCEHVADTPTLSLHATQSQDEPFGFVSADDRDVLEAALRLPIEQLVLSTGEDVGTLGTCGPVVTVEVGRQGTDQAAINAEMIALDFLRAIGGSPGTPSRGSPAIFEVTDVVEKPPGTVYEVHVDNFTLVEAGTHFASVDGEPITATEDFYPILMSAEGYTDIFGLMGERIADSPEDATLDG